MTQITFYAINSYNTNKKLQDWFDSTHILQSHTTEITFHFSSASPSSSSISSTKPYKATAKASHAESNLLPALNRSSPAWLLSDSSNAKTHSSYNRFKQVNAENLKILIEDLERKVPWQKAIIPGISSTILQCRAGMMRGNNKEDTRLLFHGCDVEGKEKIARELARLVFGSYKSFFSLGISGSSSSTLLADAVREDPRRVFLVEDIEKEFFGRLEDDEVAVKDAIFVLSCEELDCSRVRDSSPQAVEEEEKGELGKENGSYLALDLNVSAAGEEEEGKILWGGVRHERLLRAVDRAFFFEIPKNL